MTKDFCLIEMEELDGAAGEMMAMEEEEVMAVVEPLAQR